MATKKKTCQLGKVLQRLKKIDDINKIHIQIDHKTWIFVDRHNASERAENFKRNRQISEVRLFQSLKSSAV